MHKHYIYIYICVCVCVCVCARAEEMLEKTEETNGTVNIRNETEKNIVPQNVVHNTSSSKIYPLETGKHCCLLSALYERMKHVVYDRLLYILSTRCL
jgi:DNA recombination-dependent growth factor C